MSFFSVLTGGNQKRRINQSYDAANAAYGTANTNAKGYLDTGYSTAKGYIDPIIQSCQAGGKLYQDTLGINGADARTAAQANYLSDDVLAQTRAMQLKQNARRLNPGGGVVIGQDGTNVGSGVGALADSRTMLENYGNWQNRLQGEEGRGDQAAGMGANLATNNAAQQAAREEGYGSAMAGSAIGQGAALSANDNTGINNLIKIGGTVLGGFTPVSGGYGQPTQTAWGNFGNAIKGGWNKLFG